MKVKHVIEILEKEYDPEASIVVNTWDQHDFDLKTNEDWHDISQALMDETDWSWVKQDMDESVENWRD
jgi:uncharacterized protein YozE (UPF0346 family)